MTGAAAAPERPGGHLVAESLAALGRRGRLRRAGRPRAVDLGRPARRAAAHARPADGALRRLRRRRLRPRERAPRAAAPLDRPGRAQRAHRPDGGRERPRPRRGHLQPGAARAARPRPRLPARAARPARRLRARRQARRARRERRGAAGAAGRGVARRAARRRPGPSTWRSPSTCSRPRRASPSPDGARRRPAAARPRPGRRRSPRPPRLLAAAERPVLWAGGGVERSGAWEELRALAERLDAPVATTYMGKGALPGRPSARAPARAATRRPSRRCSPAADVVLAVGTELGAETTGQYAPRVRRAADPPRRRAGADRRDLPRARPRRRRAGDARGAARAPPRAGGPNAAGRTRSRTAGGGRRRDGAARAAAVRARIARGLDAQGRELERGLLADLAAAAGPDAVIAWDMTILAYWAAAHFTTQRRRRGFLYPLGSGTLGYALPAALGAQAALPGVTACSPWPATAASSTRCRSWPRARQHGLPGHAGDRRRRRLRDPARVPGGRLRADACGRSRPARLRGGRARLRRARARLPRRRLRATRWPGRSRSTEPAVVVLRETLVAAEPTP